MAEAVQDLQVTIGPTESGYNYQKVTQEENMNKICLASFVVVALALAAAGCKTTERSYDGSYPNVGAGETLVPIIRWAF